MESNKNRWRERVNGIKCKYQRIKEEGRQSELQCWTGSEGGQREDGRSLFAPVKAKEVRRRRSNNTVNWCFSLSFWVFSSLSTGIFVFVLPGEAGSQLEPVNITPSRLLSQSVCSPRAATGAQQLTSHIWIQVAVCLLVLKVQWRSVLPQPSYSCIPVSLLMLLRARTDGQARTVACCLYRLQIPWVFTHELISSSWPVGFKEFCLLQYTNHHPFDARLCTYSNKLGS